MNTQLSNHRWHTRTNIHTHTHSHTLRSLVWEEKSNNSYVRVCVCNAANSPYYLVDRRSNAHCLSVYTFRAKSSLGAENAMLPWFHQRQIQSLEYLSSMNFIIYHHFYLFWICALINLEIYFYFNSNLKTSYVAIATTEYLSAKANLTAVVANPVNLCIFMITFYWWTRTHPGIQTFGNQKV